VSVEEGTAAMLVRRREILAQGAEPLGWKIGFNVSAIQEQLGIDGPVVGFLTSDTLLAPEAEWSLDDDGSVVVESEVAVDIGPDGRAIAALLPALELTDMPDLSLEVEQILAGNVFHRGVVFGARVETREPGPGRIVVNGEVQHTFTAEQTSARLEEMVGVVATRLADAGAELRHGDRIITGVLAPPHKAAPGDTVRFELDAVGSVELSFS
jgi:2-keto-4-pentenoate hydratase